MILTHTQRLYIASAVCFIAAFSAIGVVGLPSRIDYTQLGVLNGQHIAPDIGALAPPLILTDPDGQPVIFSPEDRTAAVTVINFWATWCAPCAAEMPALQALYDRYNERGLRMIGVNLGENAATVRDWSAQMGLRFTLALDPSGQAATDYRLRGQPTTVIVARDGQIMSIVYGAADLTALERLIRPLLTEG